MLNKTASA